MGGEARWRGRGEEKETMTARAGERRRQRTRRKKVRFRQCIANAGTRQGSRPALPAAKADGIPSKCRAARVAAPAPAARRNRFLRAERPFFSLPKADLRISALHQTGLQRYCP